MNEYTYCHVPRDVRSSLKNGNQDTRIAGLHVSTSSLQLGAASAPSDCASIVTFGVCTKI